MTSKKLVPEFNLSENIKNKIDKEAAKYPTRRAAVKSALRYCQEEAGWISPNVVIAVAKFLDMKPIEVYEIATFYDMFYTEPVGRHCIRVCTNVSCMLRGSHDIVEYLRQQLGISFGETSDDGKVTLLEAECLGACGGAPMLLCGDDYFENLTTKKLDVILEQLD